MKLRFLSFVFLLSVVGAHSYAAPDDGRVNDENETKRLSLPKGSEFALPVEDPPQSAMSDNSMTFVLMGITLRGNTIFPTQELIGLIEENYVTRVSFRGLQELADTITAYYRKQGYLLARAYIPAQEIENGVVRISILEGRIENIKVENESRIPDKIFTTQTFFDSGGPLESNSLERKLLLLNDLNGVDVAGTLTQGEKVGTSDLVLKVKPNRRFDGQVELDNKGNDYTGEARYGGAFFVNTPLNIGDALALRVLDTGEGLSYSRVSWNTPVLTTGLNAELYYSYMQYELGGALSESNATGDSSIFGAGVSYPLKRSLKNNFYIGVNLETVGLEDNIDIEYTEKTNNLARLTLSGNMIGDRYVNSWSASASVGDLVVSSDVLIDDPSDKAGVYAKANLSYASLYHFAQGWSLYGSAYGQAASKNLDSSEKFSIGGADAVRAYAEGEALGDTGYLVTGEARYSFENGIELSVFADLGGVILNQDPWAELDNFVGYENTVTLAGAGVGFFWLSEYGLSVLASVAAPIGDGHSSLVLTSQSEEEDFQIWVQLVKQF